MMQASVEIALPRCFLPCRVVLQKKLAFRQMIFNNDIFDRIPN